MRVFILLIAICIFNPVSGQRNKKNEEAASGITATINEGIVYSLPRTGIRVYVKATKTDFTPGPYARFSEQLLGINDAATEPFSKWVIDKVELGTFSEPDPTQVYKALGEAGSLICLTSDGCIAGINSDISSESLGTITTNPVAYSSANLGVQFSNLSDLPFFSVSDSTNRSRPARLSIEQKAAQIASRILECRKIKFEMAAGFLDELPPDGQGYAASLNQLDNLEKEYLSLFIGISSTDDYKFSFEFIPSVTDTKGEVIFRFSEQKGILEKSDVTGKPVMLEISKISDLTSNLERLKNSENPNAGANGVYYRLPGMADVKLIQELKVIATARFPIAQFGAVAPVPEKLLDGNYSLEFHPETGAIKSISKIIN
jgi:hypothetical protein